MRPDYDSLFANQADAYDRFVSAEDYQGHLLESLLGLGLITKATTIADLGTGTGRVAFLLAPHASHVYGIEPVQGMLAVAEQKKRDLAIPNIDFLPGEHKAIPLPDHSVDLIVEGWAFLRAFTVKYPAWRPEFDCIIPEMRRILRPSGHVVLIETMGSGQIWTEAPGRVAELYRYFENELKLTRTTIRTDYRFASAKDAVDMFTFFFGDELTAQVRSAGSNIIPEATAIWHGELHR